VFQVISEVLHIQSKHNNLSYKISYMFRLIWGWLQQQKGNTNSCMDLRSRTLQVYCYVTIQNTDMQPYEENWRIFKNNFSFYIHGSVHRNSIFIRSNKMQQYAGIYLLQIYSACFGCPSHPSSGVHETVTAASGTGHSKSATTFLQRGLIRPNCCRLVLWMA